MQTGIDIINFVAENWIGLLELWFSFFTLGTLVLYIGFGFAMCAIRARKEGKTQDVIFGIDAVISVLFLILDVVLNIVVYPIVCLDFRFRYTITTISHRMSLYNEDGNERRYRKFIASLFAAALDGKDPSGDHIRGPNEYFKWLG